MAEEKKAKKSIFKEFGEFISRGNVIDLAVGVIIGGAFTAIVTALTSQILTPFINWLISLVGGAQGLESARTVLGTPVYVLDASGAATNTIDWAKTNYIDWGAFIGAIINFLLVAVILFAIVKTINTVHDKGVEAAEKAKAKVTAKKAKEQPAEEVKEEAK